MLTVFKMLIVANRNYAIRTNEGKGFVFGFGVGDGVISTSDSDQEIPFDEAQAGGNFPNLKLGLVQLYIKSIKTTFTLNKVINIKWYVNTKPPIGQFEYYC